MKTKLLKKVRKRFEIIYYPSGRNRIDKDPCVYFIDHNELWSGDVRYATDGIAAQIACDIFKKRILRIIRNEYANKLPKQPNKHKGTKLWHI